MNEQMKDILTKVSLLKLHATDHVFQPVLLLELLDDVDDAILNNQKEIIKLEKMKDIFMGMKKRFTKNGLMGSDEWTPAELEEQYKIERKEK